MTAPKNKWQPWWERANDYYGLEWRDEFARGATSAGFNPNNRMNALFGMYAAGFVRNVFATPKSHVGVRNNEKH